MVMSELGSYWYFSAIWWFAVLGALFLVIRASAKKAQRDQNRETPLEILQKRYARGEIDGAAYDRMKAELTNPVSRPRFKPTTGKPTTQSFY